MYSDEIIREVWRNRDEYSAEHNCELSKIVTDLQKRQQRRPLSKLADRRPAESREDTTQR